MLIGLIRRQGYIETSNYINIRSLVRSIRGSNVSLHVEQVLYSFTLFHREMYTFIAVSTFFLLFENRATLQTHCCSKNSFSKRPLKIYFPLYSRKGWRCGSERMAKKKDRNVSVPRTMLRGRRGKSIDLFAVYRSNKEFQRQVRNDSRRASEFIRSSCARPATGSRIHPRFANGNCKNIYRQLSCVPFEKVRIISVAELWSRQFSD